MDKSYMAILIMSIALTFLIGAFVEQSPKKYSEWVKK